MLSSNVLNEIYNDVSECSGGRWGESCANDCGCSQGAERCDPVTGCVCKEGFEGKFLIFYELPDYLGLSSLFNI